MPRFKAVLFDFDGTVVDTNTLIINSWQYMARTALGTELPEDVLKATFGEPLYDAVEKVARQTGYGHMDTEELVGLYRTYQILHRDNSYWAFDGIEKSLRELKEAGVIMGIVTSRSNPASHEMLRTIGLDGYFTDLVGSEDTDIHKPLPEPALLCCRKLGIAPAEAVMIGDSVFDLQCANNAGCASAFAAWSFCTSREKALAEGNPTFIVETPDRIGELL